MDKRIMIPFELSLLCIAFALIGLSLDMLIFAHLCFIVSLLATGIMCLFILVDMVKNGCSGSD